jgi:hypothetical protein
VQQHAASDLLILCVSGETLFQHAQRCKRQQNMQQLWVTPSSALHWLQAVRVNVPTVLLPLTTEVQQRLRHEVLAQWEAALGRCLRRARLAFLTEQPKSELMSGDHANFPLQTLPDGTTGMGYRIEAMLAEPIMKAALDALQKSLKGAQLKPHGWERIVALLREEVGEIDLHDTLIHVLTALAEGTDVDELTLPLPRLHIPQHLYSPLLLAAPAAVVEEGAQLSLLDDQPLGLRISPPPLENSEARLVWDVRRVWERLHTQAQWAGVEVVLLRNLADVGVGLFAAEGFYPDFLLWLKRGNQQALAFVEPKGLRHQWPTDKFDLLEKVVPAWKFSVPVCGFVLSSNSEQELQTHQAGFTWATAPSVLLHQDTDGFYVERLLATLRALLPA